MGQRGTCTVESSVPVAPSDALTLSIFATELGWMGLLGREGAVAHVLIGHPSADSVREEATKLPRSGRLPESDWYPDLRRRLQRYAQGEPVEFDDVPLALPPMTPFQSRVVAAVRQVRYGMTVTYGELAERAGAPRAARAVGTVMSSNRLPILIPCHRVVGAGGHLGGYSAPQGLSLKRRLLAMEAAGGEHRERQPLAACGLNHRSEL